MARKAVPSLRSQDLVFTLFGDYLLERDQPVWTGALITLLGQLGLSPMAVRTVLSRMTRKGWLTAERRGTRSWYGLTPKGHRLLASGRERIYHPRRDHDVGRHCGRSSPSPFPRTRRRLRDALRVRLSWLGCGSLANGVWISPRDVRTEIGEIAADLKVARHLEVFRGEHAGGIRRGPAGGAVLGPRRAQPPVRRLHRALAAGVRALPPVRDDRRPGRDPQAVHRPRRLLPPPVPPGARVPRLPAGRSLPARARCSPPTGTARRRRGSSKAITTSWRARPSATWPTSAPRATTSPPRPDDAPYPRGYADA